MRSIASFLAFAMTALLVTALVMPAALAEEDKAGEKRLVGRIMSIDEDNSVIMIQVNNAPRTVVYNSKTKFTVMNNPGSLDELREGERVICLGEFDEKLRLVATRIDGRRN